MRGNDGATDARATAGSAYLSGATGVLVTRVSSVAASAVALWLLSRMLGTSDFAGYTTAMSVLMLLGLAAGFGIERTMLMNIAGKVTGSAHLQGARMMRRIGSIVLVTGSAVGLAAAAVWSGVPALSGDVPVGEWLLRLWPLVPAVALTLALVTWYQANHIFGLPQALWGLVDVTRCMGFAAIFALGLGAYWVAVAALFAAMLPIFILVTRAIGQTASEPGDVGLRDVADGLQFFVIRFCAAAMIHLDILILSVFAPAPIVAQYVIASRLAAVLETGHQIFTPVYAARARRHMAAGTSEVAWREYGSARTLGLLATLPLICLFLVFGTDILAFFGEFGVAFVPFAILLAGHLLNVGFGNHVLHLSMTNDLPFAAANRVFGLASFAGLLLVLVPGLGSLGAALAFFIALLAYHLVGALLLKWRQDRWVAAPVPMAILSVAVGAIGLAAIRPDLAVLASVPIGCTVLALLMAERHLIRGVLKELHGLIAR